MLNYFYLFSFNLKNPFSLAITKIDVLDDFDEIKVAVDYKMNGEVLSSFPGIYFLFLIINYF